MCTVLFNYQNNLTWYDYSDKKIIKIEKYRAFVRVTHLVFVTYKMINFLVTFERFSLPLGEI